MKHPPGKRGLLPVTKCIFILALYLGARAWGKCLLHSYNTWSPCCVLQRTAARKNKRVEAKTLPWPLWSSLKHNWRGKLWYVGTHVSNKNIGANLSCIKTHRSNNPPEKVYVGNRYVINASKQFQLHSCATLRLSSPCHLSMGCEQHTPAHRAEENTVGEAVKGWMQSQLRVKGGVILISWNAEKEVATVA